MSSICKSVAIAVSRVVACVFLIGASDTLAVAQDQRQLAEAERLNAQVIQLYRDGKYADAIPVAKRVLNIWETQHGPNHPDVAFALSNLGAMNRRLGNYAVAKTLHERALRIRQKVHGQNHADVATSATFVGMANESLGDLPTAEQYYQLALKIREKVFGDEHPEIASALNNIANLLRTQSKLKEAEAMFLRGLEIRRKTQGADHLDNAPSLDNLASIYKDQGRYAEAEKRYLQALAIREKHRGREHPDTAITVNNLAGLYTEQSRYAEAEPLYRRALKIRETLLGYDHPLTASTVGNLGGNFEKQGDFSQAEALYRRALKSSEKSVGRNHVDTGIFANNLASVYRRLDRREESARLYLQALAIFENKLGAEHRHTAQVLSNLGGLRERQGDFPTAERHYRRSLEIRREVLGDDHPDTAQSLNNLALLMAADNRVDNAIAMLKQSLETRRRSLGNEHPTTVDARNNLASYLEQQHDKQSITQFDLARRGMQAHVVKELPALEEQQQALFLKANYERGLHEALTCGLLHADDPDTVQKSAGWLLNGKAVGREALAQRTLAKRKNAKPTAPPEWVELNELRKAIPADAVLIDIARFSRFDFELRPGAATWLPAHYAAWITPAAGNGDVQLIDLGPADRIDALVKDVRAQLLKAHGDDGEVAAVGEEAAVQRVTRSLQSIADLVWKPLVPHLGNAEELLLSPDADLWLLPWAALPVGEKADDDAGELLVEKYSLRLLISGRDLVRPQVVAKLAGPIILANPKFDERAAVKKQSILGIFRTLLPADDDELRSVSALTKLPDVTPLPNTELEAIAIQSPLEQYTGLKTKIYKQRYALESVVKRLESPQVAVLATHGFFLPEQQVSDESPAEQISTGIFAAVLDRAGRIFENPLRRCGLLLTGCNQQGVAVGADDGILTGAEVTSIDLRGTELVVLSACETGLGDINQGEGVAGLRQAFQLAGAESVMASLWQVSDRSTSLLISDFFRNLAAGQSKAVALQNAQLSRIKSRRQRYGAAHPFYWAAFTLTGR